RCAAGRSGPRTAAQPCFALAARAALATPAGRRVSASGSSARAPAAAGERAAVPARTARYGIARLPAHAGFSCLGTSPPRPARPPAAAPGGAGLLEVVLAGVPAPAAAGTPKGSPREDRRARAQGQ